ncbi:unnamed protein product [marine sediment metagenome]|uniref:Uncharacterized protein n=1 Tax=marine sediment metagenome TaxID=412755 RepID=X1EYC1_9ZZZZ
MSYVRSDEEMLRKIQSFSHAKDIFSGWYENIWLKWRNDMTNLHPSKVGDFKKTISVSESKYHFT